MRVIVFDTETTGLPKSNIINKYTIDSWPYIVQFSYIVYNMNEHVVEKIRDYIIKMPNNVIIPEESIKIHKITNEISSSQGINIDEVLIEFMEDVRDVNMVIAHNIEFDIKMVIAALFRHNYEDMIVELQNMKKMYCTMQESIDLCAIKTVTKTGKEYVKFPKLVELHEKLFGTKPNQLHNALNDIYVCLRCFYKLQTGKDICDFDSEFKTLISVLF